MLNFARQLWKNWMFTGLFTVLTLLLINAILISRNSIRLQKQSAIKDEIYVMMDNINGLEYITIHGLDIGLRGYAITNKYDLMDPYNFAREFTETLFVRLGKNAKVIDYPTSNIDSLKVVIDDYMAITKQMKLLVDEGKSEEFREQLALDPGVEIWHKYNTFRQMIFTDLGTQRREIDANIKRNLQTNFIIQIIVIVIIIPSIFFIFFRMRKLQNESFSQNKIVVAQNEELQESHDFLSHIIRGPICRLEGLLYLLKKEEENKQEMLDKIYSMAREIKDLTGSTRNAKTG